MVSLDIPAFILTVLSLVFVFNPQFVSFWGWLLRKCRECFSPTKFQCEVLQWRDFNGQLHAHSGQGGLDRCNYCIDARIHPNASSCWHKTLALVFNNAWDNHQRRKSGPKPPQLPLNETFLQTEARIILAYFLCTARLNYFSEEMLGSSLQYVELQERDGLVVAHLGRAEKSLPDLTKVDIERILAGWPPFYRETFTSLEGHRLASPVLTHDHVRRPGWIIAIGLAHIQPTDVYIDSQAIDGDRSKSLFPYAIRRAQRVLDVHFEREWTGHQAVARTRAAVDNMLHHGQSAELVLAGAALAESNTIAYPDRSRYTDLTRSQCEALMRVFQTMAVNAEDKAILDPVLEACMHRIEAAIAVALKYSSTNRVLRVPPALRGDRVVYLRGCQMESGG
jgi:hypothetical protein